MLIELRECTNLHDKAEVSTINMDQAFIKKQKGIYETMNK